MTTQSSGLDLAHVQRDPCCCLPKQPCPACLAWGHGRVLVAGQPLCTVVDWSLAHPRAAVMQELTTFLDHPEYH